MKEIWKDIKGYEGLYQASNLGRVKSLARDICNGRINYTSKTRILNLSETKERYLSVGLCKEGKREYFKVHRLIASTFIPNPNNYPCVNHKNEIKSDNNVNNLEWCTYKYNSNYGNCIKKRTEKCSKKVYQYTLSGDLVKEWNSVNECGRNGFGCGNISECCLKKRKTHKGYKWSYELIKKI